MFRSPYSTTALKSHRMSKVVDAINKEIIEGELIRFDSNVRIIDHDSNVPSFHHPVIVKDYNDKDEVIIDIRGVTAKRRDTGELITTPDFEFLKNRARIMTFSWLNGDQKNLLSVSDLPMMLFGKLISETLARRMNLDIQTQLSIEVIVDYYYLCLFEDVMATDEESMLKYIRHISRISRIPAEHVMSILEDERFNKPMYTISDLTNCLKDSELSVRLNKLSPGILFTMLGGIWYGTNPVEMVAVALEHPPTWVSMLYNTVYIHGYSKTVLGKLLQREDRRQELSKAFLLNVKRLITVQ